MCENRECCAPGKWVRGWECVYCKQKKRYIKKIYKKEINK